MLLGATSRTGGSRSADRNQAGGLSEADGQQKQFVLPDDEAPADNAVAPEASVGQSQTKRSDARTRPDARTRSDARPRSRDPLDAGRDDQAVNPLAAASQPEPVQGAVVTVSQGTVNPADALKIAGAAQQAGRGANGLTNIAAWWQSAQGANQPATGRVQAMNRQAEGTAAAWLQGQDNARAAAGESQQASNQVPAAMVPGAEATGGQPAGKDLGPRTSRMPALADATAAAGAATATAGAATATTGAATASPASGTVPGATNEVVPANTEAKPTSPDVLPTAAAWLQGQDNARAAAGESQQAANQVPAAMAPGAKATGGQAAGKDLGPRTSRMPAPADATAAAGAATATTGSAATASGTVPGAATAAAGAANEVVPAGAEAKPTSQNVLPTAAAGETAQTEQAGQARGHRATTQSLSGMARQGVASAVGEKSSAEVDPNLQAQAKPPGRPEQTAKSRSASLLEAARPVEAHATGATSFLAGSQHIDSAAQAAPHGTQGAGEQRSAEASRPADQIIENVRHAVANGQREVTINLNPPELGRVRLRMYTEGNEIHGRLEVDNPRTLTEIRHQAELLIQRLAEDGIAIRRLEVHQMSNNGGQTGSFSPQHQDATGQMPWSHTRHMPVEQQHDRESADAAGAAAAGAAALAGTGESLSAGSLNVWM